jgi:pimeloyl-ACP methyl ester carboxylesterase
MRLIPRSRRGTLLVAAIGLALIAAAVFAYQRWPEADAPPADTGARGWSVNVDGHNLYIECQGAGSPTVVLDAGLGDASTVWDDVVLAIDGPVRVCAYDRWGLGLSQARAAGTRPIGDATSDLHALLAAAEVSPPYVLVSHSIAGLIHRDYTQRYPSEVAGLVMVDSAPDDWNLYMKVDEFTYGSETLDIAAVAASLRASDDLGGRPVVVILGATSNQIDMRPGFRDYWLAAQRGLAARSTDSMVIVAADSDHGIPTTQPGLVSTSVGLVVTAVTTDQPLAACPALASVAENGGRCDDIGTQPRPAPSQL